MFGDKVPESDKNWNNFVLLLSIMDYLMAPLISPNVIGYLRSLIEDHHVGFTELYPSSPITPKFHYMVHYPDWILRYIYHSLFSDYS